jgi:hypothetical protein
MSLHLHQVHRAAHALKTATEHDGAKGALAGALGVAGTTAALVGTAGLVLTPLGWVVLGTAGGIAGGTGLLKKLRGKA